MPPLVSIIVPVYNAEKNIGRCIESVLSQTYKDFELILMDDGSKDDSGKICDEYAMKDERIRVIHKENSGVSDTRNQGIAMARGEYLQFIDSDDWITPDATGNFVRMAQDYQCDMVIADFYRVIGERVSQKGAIDKEGLLDRDAYATYMMQKPADFYYGVLWNKFFKRSIIEKYQMKMDSSISWCEDFIFNLEYIRNIQSVYVMKVPVYYYVKTKGSLVSQGMSVKNTIRMKRTVFAFYNSFYKEVFEEEDYEKRRGQIYRFLIDAAGDGDVAPTILPGSYKLGAERISVSEATKIGEGFLFENYRERKLRERMIEVAAIKNEMTIGDIKVLYFLSQSHKSCSLKEMASILSISRGELSLAIQKLLSRELIEAKEKEKKSKRRKEKTEDTDKKKRLSSWDYVVTPEAETVLNEILYALDDFEDIQYEGFTEEEIALYERLREKRNRNIADAL